MNKIYILAATLLFLFLNLNLAQNQKSDANLIGDVQCNGTHVPYINVTLDGTTIGTVTDATGHFQLTNIPVGIYTVRVSGVGYKGTTKQFNAEPNRTEEIKFLIEEDVLNMEEVVVSADRNQTNRSEAPVIVTSISPKLFETTQSVNLAEGLCFTPGLRTECNCQNCGFTQLRMNGLDGPYTQVLMNSRPVFSGLAGVYGLELIPANMIERLEVVRGGGSALFGGNAIAGTVNIITKEPVRNTFMADGRYSLVGLAGKDGHHDKAGFAGDAQFNMNASMVTDDGSSGAYLYAMLRDKEAHDENGDGFSESVLINNTTFGFSAYFKPGAKSKITLDGYRINEFRRGGNMLEFLPHEADVAEQVEHTITGGNLALGRFVGNKYNKLSVYAAGQSVERNSYYGAEQDPFAYGYTTDFTSTIGAQYIHHTDLLFFAPSTTVIGIDNNSNLIEDTKLGAEAEENAILSNQLVNTVGTFVQHDWKSEKVNLSFGLRYDNYLIRDLHGVSEERAKDVSKDVLVPRFGFLYKVTPKIRLRAGYARGYRAPQVFNEDLHIELVNAKRVLHRNSPDLIQETSHTFSLSLNTDFVLKESPGNFLMEGFYTRLNDAFADEYNPIEGSPGDWEYVRINAEGVAMVYGVNFEYSSYFNRSFEGNVGFTLQESKYEKAIEWGDVERFPDHVTNNFIKAPDAYGYATFNWHATEKLEASLTANYTGSMYVPHYGLAIYSESELSAMEGTEYLEALETNRINRFIVETGDVIQNEKLEKTEDFLIFDFLVNFTVKLSNETNLQIYAGVKNIFNQTQTRHDRGKYRDAGYIYGPCQPRTLNVGIKLMNF